MLVDRSSDTNTFIHSGHSDVYGQDQLGHDDGYRWGYNQYTSLHRDIFKLEERITTVARRSATIEPDRYTYPRKTSREFNSLQTGL